jgi:transaldolase/glucose-6-phosphate isomerase
MRFELGPHADAVRASQVRWQAEGRTGRLWARDAAIFSNRDEARWLGWLDLPNAPEAEAIGNAALREAIDAHPADTAVVLGMGGSSLWPDVLGRTFNDRPAATETATAAATAGAAKAPRRRPLFVLDSTVPDAIEAFLSRVDATRCLFFVSSKSGSTIEPNALFELIHARLAAKLGAAAASRHFVAITDPGSALEARARAAGFLGIALGRADVGGRFSALSPFGLLPAAAMGLDPERLRARARSMAEACGPTVAIDSNPGVALGVALGTLAQRGCDKLTLSLSPAIAGLGGWIEQLVAESTGKSGQGILPISDEGLGEPSRYAKDRIFVELTVAGDATAKSRASQLDALARAGHPTIRIELAGLLDLGRAVFQWEIATAVVGAVLGLNPFDQPDVESAKLATRELMTAADGAPGRGREAADLEADGIRIFAAKAFSAAARGAQGDPARLVKALLESLAPNDSFLLNAFLADSPELRAKLERIRAAVGAARRVATALSFGPRYLHSTGQLHKGGPNRLVGLQIWQSAGSRKGGALPIPGIGGDFDRLAEAQAVGDFRVLSERGRRMLGIEVGADPLAALDQLAHWIQGALS